MKAHIVLIPIDFYNARKVCEKIENTTFTKNEISDFFEKELIDKYSIVSLSDFMDCVNNQELDDLTNYFISYIILK